MSETVSEDFLSLLVLFRLCNTSSGNEVVELGPEVTRVGVKYNRHRQRKMVRTVRLRSGVRLTLNGDKVPESFLLGSGNTYIYLSLMKDETNNKS